MINKPAITSEKIHPIIENRWSPRAFDPSRPLDQNTLTALLEAARWAPSCMNEQPWRFVVCAKAEHGDAWESLLGCLAEKNQQWAQHAPVLLLAVAMQQFSRNQNPNRWAEYDTGASSMALTLQATALGLVSHQMGGFDVERCRDKFNLPEQCTPMAVIAVGYQAEADALDDELREREHAERNRAELTQRFYFGRWA